MFRKIALTVGALVALVAVIGSPVSGTAAPDNRDWSLQAASQADTDNAPAVIVPLATVEETTVADPKTPTTETGVEVLSTSVDNPQTTIPAPTNEDGSARYLGQDNGDGATASAMIASLLTQAQTDPSWRGTVTNVSELNGDTNTSVWEFRAGDTMFTLVLSRDSE